MNISRHFFRDYWPALCWSVVILLLIGLPVEFFPRVTSFWDWLKPDKLVHLFIFGVFAFLLLWGRRGQYSELSKRSKLRWTAFLTGVFYGGLTELLQHLVFPTRHGHVLDFVANTLGCLIGVWLFHILFRKK